MNDITTFLPEDLAPVLGRRAQAKADVRINSQRLEFSFATDQLLGSPDRAEILFGRQSRMLAIRPVSEGGWKIYRSKHGAAIGQHTVITSLGLPPIPKGHGHRFPARLVEGALLCGPLPRGEE